MEEVEVRDGLGNVRSVRVGNDISTHSQVLVEQAQDEHWVQVEEERARLLAMLEDALSISQLLVPARHAQVGLP